MLCYDSKDIIWINLKILGKIPPYHRINTQNELFYIEKNSIWNPVSLWRFFRGDHRALAVKRIDKLIEEASQLLNNIHLNEEHVRLLDHLRQAAAGLENLKQTYEEDMTTKASIERLLDKISNILPDPIKE